MDGLPLEFKLFMKGKHVGYENHFDNPDKKEIEIFHRNLTEVTGRILPPYNFYIKHDKKRQCTGFKDRNGEKICFGDKLKDGEGNYFTVVISNGAIEARSGVFHVPHVMGMYMDRLAIVK